MSLLFSSGSTDNVDCGGASALENLDAGTVLAWVKPSGVGNNVRYIAGKTNSGGMSGWQLNRIGADGTRLRLFRARSTTNQQVSSASGFLSTGVWAFVAASFDVAGSPRMVTGGLGTLASDTSSLVNNGSGTKATDAGQNFVIGNVSGTPPNAWDGAIACLAFFNRVLTVAEIQSWQFRPRVMSGCVGFWQLGWNGTSTQPDWSGNGNAGTVTGATVDAGVPLGPPFGYDIALPYVVSGGGGAPAGAGIVEAVGELSGAGATGHSGGGSITAVGSLAGAGYVSVAGSGSIAAAGSLAGSGQVAHSGAGSLSAIASLAGAGAATASGSGSITSLGAIAGAGYSEATGGGGILAIGALVGVGNAPTEGVPAGAGSISSVGSLAGAGVVVASGSGSITAAASLAGSGYVSVGGGGSIVAAGSLAGAGISDDDDQLILDHDYSFASRDVRYAMSGRDLISSIASRAQSYSFQT